MNRSVHNPGSAGIRVLLVEDDKDSATILKRRLGSRGFDVYVCSDGASAVVAATEQTPQLILMDINLPGIDGCEATRQIRRKPEGLNIPIIGVSSLAFAEDRKRALACGCNDYETKPLDFNRLLEKMCGYLGMTPPLDGSTAAGPKSQLEE